MSVWGLGPRGSTRWLRLRVEADLGSTVDEWYDLGKYP